MLPPTPPQQTKKAYFRASGQFPLIKVIRAPRTWIRTVRNLEVGISVWGLGRVEGSMPTINNRIERQRPIGVNVRMRYAGPLGVTGAKLQQVTVRQTTGAAGPLVGAHWLGWSYVLEQLNSSHARRSGQGHTRLCTPNNKSQGQ